MGCWVSVWLVDRENLRVTKWESDYSGLDVGIFVGVILVYTHYRIFHSFSFHVISYTSDNSFSLTNLASPTFPSSLSSRTSKPWPLPLQPHS